MTEDKAESFHLWDSLLLVAMKYQEEPEAWAVDEIKQLQECAELLSVLDRIRLLATDEI